MIMDKIPAGLVPSSGSFIFTEDTIPAALQREHTLAPGHWGVLHVFEGSIRFVDLETAVERVVTAPDLITIHPGAPHRVVVESRLRCRVDFFRDLDAEESMRTPGAFADEAVRLSLERCESSGDFADVFYRNFLNCSPEVAPYFAETDFARQRQVLRESVHMMVTRDVGDADMREMADRLGRTHSREARNIRTAMYELWLDSICAAAQALDPEWDDSLERKWRVRLRAGMQIVMAAY